MHHELKIKKIIHYNLKDEEDKTSYDRLDFRDTT